MFEQIVSFPAEITMYKEVTECAEEIAVGVEDECSVCFEVLAVCIEENLCFEMICVLK